MALELCHAGQMADYMAEHQQGQSTSSASHQAMLDNFTAVVDTTCKLLLSQEAG